jgi:hypothetical protein
MLAYDRPTTPALSTPTAVAILSLTIPSAPSSGIRGGE